MRPHVSTALRLFLTVLIAALAAGACSSRPAGDRLLAIDDGRLAAFHPAKGLRTLADDPLTADLTALAHDPESDRSWGLTRHRYTPRLVEIGRDGTVREVGPLQAEGIVVRVADAITWDGRGNRLLVTAGTDRFASSYLLPVDPATARARRAIPITGSIQNDADALARVGDVLLMIDNGVGDARLYTLDPKSGEATAVGEAFEPAIGALAFDTKDGVLYGLDRELGTLLRLVPGDDGRTPKVAPVEASGPLTAVASTTPWHRGRGRAGAWQWSKQQGSQPPPSAAGPEVFGDDFESGDTEAWDDGMGGG